MTRRLITALALLASLLAIPALTAAPAHASTSPGNAALNWAEAHALGHWYSYGGSGLAYYDCSGLVERAVAEADGISLPHNAAMITASGKVYRIPLADARRGDLLTWGWPAYHIEFKTAWTWLSFGAHHSGTRTGWASTYYFRPSAAWRIR